MAGCRAQGAHVSVRSRRSALKYALLPHDGSSFSGALIPAADIVDLLNQLEALVELWDQHGQCSVR